jgi:hypothetical protein
MKKIYIKKKEKKLELDVCQRTWRKIGKGKGKPKSSCTALKNFRFCYLPGYDSFAWENDSLGNYFTLWANYLKTK